MDAVQQLVALEDIRQLKARLARCMDEKDWDGYAACHTPDAVSHTFQTQLGASGPVVGGDAIAEMLRVNMADKTMIHHNHWPEIDLTSEHTASGVWPVEYVRFWLEDGQEWWGQGYGHYHETYERLEGRWLISSRELINIKSDQGKGQRPPPPRP